MSDTLLLSHCEEREQDVTVETSDFPVETTQNIPREKKDAPNELSRPQPARCVRQLLLTGPILIPSLRLRL